MGLSFKMIIKDGIVQVLDALTGRQITEASTDIVEVSCDKLEIYEDVTNYRWLANQLGLTISEVKEIYGKD